LPSRSDVSAVPPRVALLVGHEDIAPEYQHFLDRIVRTRGGIFGVYQVLLHTPDAAERIAHIGAFFLYESILPPAIRALIGLIAAREFDCAYTWRASVGAARAAGIAGELIDALEHGKTLSGVTVPQQVLLDFCYQLLRGNHHVDDATYRAAVAQWGIAATVQIAATLGYGVMMSVVANTFDIAPQDDDSRPAL
jgi:4-carboxymuconolactone decarboxylase